MEWTHIVIHHSASRDGGHLSYDNIRRWHLQRGWRDIGYHFVVEQVEGEIVCIVGRPLTMQGAHAPGYNRRAIGICFVGDFTEHPPTKEMLGTAAHKLIVPLMKTFNIPVENVLFHRQVRETECPGRAFKREMLISAILEELKSA